MKRVQVTYEDIWWPDPEDENYETEQGFVIGSYNRYPIGDLSNDEYAELRAEATRDLEDEIECFTCIAKLRWNGNLWLDENGSISGVNQWMEYPHHAHWPEKDIYELAVDLLEDFGAIEEDYPFRWYSEFETVDYRYGIERQYAVHFDHYDWSENDMRVINSERDSRIANRKRIYQEYMEGVKRYANN